ncbi:response regulator [Holdemanella biformis]|uniref:histidine kinase n=1 Tax=Holdemanella porci TaxID=2652276 RepID=A0A6N7V3M3_9FIRM|nr:ATP-binding protein [Holdemanella porci]MSS56893.1 response regulator [Holdemanella porci]
MQEILSNLISNAIKYMPEGGKVLIDVQELPYNQEGYTLIQTKVSDTGIGMSEEFLPSLFELFTRERNTTLSKIPGTGLGMAIVKNLVDLMNGSIEVESELGKGSTFTITIPHKIAYKDYTNRNIESSNEFDIDFKGKRILLAEDNELNVEITTTILSEMGFKVKTVEDGILCVNEMQHQLANTFDLILMDIQIPNMDGYKATDCIRHLSQPEKANIPIIAMSANTFEEDKKKAFDVKMNDYITKPIDFQKMEEVLKQVLSKKDPLS